ncbi:MAG TPA: ABC transporter permease [Chthoniobacterales bacterium]|jgi:putative ABC transport system permease protein
MPDWKTEIRRQLVGVSLSPEREIEIVEELSQHLQDQYEKAISRGATEEDAKREVLEDLNVPALLSRELKRVERRVSQNPVVMGTESRSTIMRDIGQDLRYALRMLLKNPGFATVAILALALGIGANSAIFSVVNTVLLKPLPYKNPQQLVTVWENATHLGFPKNTPSPANFLDWRRQNTVFQGMAAMAWESYNLTGIGEPERLDARRVSANLFDLLGVQPVVGRNFLPQEDKPGTHVVILSYGLWQRRFASNPQVIGQAINLSGESYTVVGVMPPTVELPGLADAANWHDQLWVPIAFTSEEAARRGSHYLEVIARMKADVTLKQARAEMETIAARLAQQYPDENLRIGSVVTPLQEEAVGDMRPALLVLLGAVGFVLLIACANVANLLLARAAVRQKEIALRLALGASRARLTRQFLTESIVLAALGGALGLLLAVGSLHVLKTFIPDTVSQAQAITIDGKVLAFTLFVSLLTGIVFGLAPATQASKFDLNDSLKEGARDSSGGGKSHRLRGLLVIGEVAVSFLLLIGAGLLINSFLHLRHLDPGFNPDHLLTVKVSLPDTKYPDKEKKAAFFNEVVRRVQPLPGVESVAVANNLPFTYNGDSMPIGIEGRVDPPPDQRLDVIFRVVGPDYFKTMKIPLLKGRTFTDHDRAGSANVAVVSEQTARHFWPGENPIGKRLKPGSTTSDSPWREVVGVVEDVRQNDYVKAPKMQMYFSYYQITSFPPNALVIRTKVDPLSLAATVRNAIWEVDKDQPVSDIRTMDDIVSAAVARQRFSMLLLAVFAALALVLAAVGIYGVMSYAVAQRTREIGIRMALGAQRSDILRMTVAQGLKLVGLGLVIGLAAAFLLTRVMASLLFGISATDPLTFLSISLVLLSVAVLASYLPARRATKVDPMIALRAQ